MPPQYEPAPPMNCGACAPVVADILPEVFNDDEFYFEKDISAPSTLASVVSDTDALIDEITDILFEPKYCESTASVDETRAKSAGYCQRNSIAGPSEEHSRSPRFLAPRLIEFNSTTVGTTSPRVVIGAPTGESRIVDMHSEKIVVAVKTQSGNAKSNSNPPIEVGPNSESLPGAIRAQFKSAKEYRKHVAIPRYLRKRASRDWKKAAAPLYPSRTAAASRRKRENGQFMEHKTEWVSVGDYSSKKRAKKL